MVRAMPRRKGLLGLMVPGGQESMRTVAGKPGGHGMGRTAETHISNGKQGPTGSTLGTAQGFGTPKLPAPVMHPLQQGHTSCAPKQCQDWGPTAQTSEAIGDTSFRLPQ